MRQATEVCESNNKRITTKWIGHRLIFKCSQTRLEEAACRIGMNTPTSKMKFRTWATSARCIKQLIRLLLLRCRRTCSWQQHRVRAAAYEQVKCWVHLQWSFWVQMAKSFIREKWLPTKNTIFYFQAPRTVKCKQVTSFIEINDLFKNTNKKLTTIFMCPKSK